MDCRGEAENIFFTSSRSPTKRLDFAMRLDFCVRILMGLRPEFSNMFENATRQNFRTCLKIAAFTERPGVGIMKFKEPFWRIKIGVKF
jgi:hypothetical protein